LVTSEAAIGAGGTVYVVSRVPAVGSGASSVLNAVLPTGEVAWTAVLHSYDGAGLFGSPPTIGPDGSIYVAAPPGIQAFASDGTLRWRFSADAGYSSGFPPAVGPDGTVYYTPVKASSVSPTFVALDSAGHVKWKTDTGRVDAHGPALAADGTTFGCGQGGGMADNLYALRADGTVAWTKTISADGWGCHSTPAIGPSGNVLFELHDRLASFDKNGGAAFSLDISGSEGQAPAVAADGTLYFGSHRGLQAASPDGVVLWTELPQQGEDVFGSPAIGADGTVYVRSVVNAPPGGTLYAIGP
jgi:hypothetical protein